MSSTNRARSCFADFTVSKIQQEGEDAGGKPLGRTVLYTANMLCEGPVQGIYDIIVGR